MGTYKVFNGTDWVNICDCQVHIRNASNNWQLLDPRNCVTKYWTGTEWCEVTCCTCLEGYTLNNQTNTCEKVERIPATASGGTFYPITVGNRNIGYGSLGAAIYPNITGAVFPLNGFGFPDYVVKDNAGTGTTYPLTTSIPNNLIFDSQNIYDTRGRLNYSSMWGTGYPNNTLVTVRFCITITEAKTYIFALAGDNQVNASITSTTFQGGVTDLNLINLWGSNSPTGSPEVPTNTRPFNYWHMFPIDLPVGTHTFKLSGYNFSGDAAFGAEVYNISITDMLALMASTTATPADLEPYILFTTKNLIQSPPLLLPAPGQTGITYTCPSGYTFTDCYGVPQCTINTSYPCGGTPPDPDPCACTTGEVVIGTQTWTCRNLDVTEYRNGDPIPEVTDPAVWQTLTTGAWRYYDNDPVNGPIYGKLYNWYAVNDPRGLAPNGYKIPTQSDWNILQGYLNTLPVGNNAGGKMKQAGTMLWNAPNTDATNSSCFTGLPGGWVNFVGSFYEIGNTGHWWSSTQDGVDLASARILSYNSGIFSSQSEYVGNGLSIRLLKEDLPPAGCTEPEVIIGTQRWTRTNLNVTQYRNGDPIPQVTDPVAWSNLTTGAWCYYNNDPASEAIYGKLYNAYAVNDQRGLAPDGFHIPTDAEWVTLLNYLGGLSVAGGKLKEVGTTHWNFPNTGATDESCFTGLPGGYRFGGGTFTDIGVRGMFWTSTIDNSGGQSNNWSHYLYYDTTDVYNSRYEPNNGLSVRLIRN